MLKRILKFVTGTDIDEVLQSQARQVREIAKDLRLSVVPEIFNDLQCCSICKKSQLLLVHPDEICFECFVAAVNEFHDEAFK